jgi:hypothetical protein
LPVVLPAPGLFIILTGSVAVDEHSQLGMKERIVSQGQGNFIGELAQLAGRVPSPIPAGSTDQASLSIQKASYSLATMPARTVIYWKRPGGESSLSAMCGQNQSLAKIVTATRSLRFIDDPHWQIT